MDREGTEKDSSIQHKSNGKRNPNLKSQINCGTHPDQKKPGKSRNQSSKKGIISEKSHAADYEEDDEDLVEEKR